ncbi:DUF1549 and DUF1553 domain-containing protein, partial [Planctomycetaceae bacterium]|nr:DUF1549 and DUF1553 domain-containing protein [Planctomycetaceae bacterium]
MKKLRIILSPLIVVLLISIMIGMTIRPGADPAPLPSSIPDDDDFGSIVDTVNEELLLRRESAGLDELQRASDLTVLRRLSLSLHGTIPSLEEIRQFERVQQTASESKPDLITRWTERLLTDSRFSDYFAERLARSLVGTDGGQFVVYRRDRFVDWLAEQLESHRPWHDITRDVIADKGLWTGKPAVNFITAGIAGDDLDHEELTGKTVRAFLGQRIDCAQCHDHPFDDWKQSDFEGLAAFYGQVNLTLVGIEDKSSLEYEVEDHLSLETRQVAPAVPFGLEWLPEQGSRREQLAGWITHADNRRFSRAITNRIWALMLGAPYYSNISVDDIPDPPEKTDLLDLLADDFREHNYDLRRLVRVITATDLFRASSQSSAETDQEYAIHKEYWGVFPMTRLRPEQLIGSMLQSSSIKTIDQNSHLLFRTMRFFREQDFVRDYGDLGPDELDRRAGTITQALLRMNGNLTKELIEANPFNSTGRVANFSDNDRECIDNSYLVCLTRHPTADEMAFFENQLAELKDQQRT